jgi:hypothetical protein
MQCLLPHEASTTWAGGTEPWASIQLRRRRPKAVDRLAISSQSRFSVMGENFGIANQRQERIPSPGLYQYGRSEKPLWGDLAARRGFGLAPASHKPE